MNGFLKASAVSLMLPLLSLSSVTMIHGQAVNQDGVNKSKYDEYRRVDDKLNFLYQKLYLKLSIYSRDKLKSSERSWMKFRDDECDFELSFRHDNSISGELKYQCFIELTSRRVIQLNNQIQCHGVEGDVSC